MLNFDEDCGTTGGSVTFDLDTLGACPVFSIEAFMLCRKEKL